MDPITLAAGAIALGALVQLYNSEKARGAEAERLEELKRIFDEIKPADYDLKIEDPPKFHEEMLQSPQFAGEINAPKYNLDQITPEQFKLLEKFVPQIAPYIAEKNPELIKDSEARKHGREAQMAALRKFMQVGAGEFDPEYQEAVTKASRQAQSDAQSRQASILQDFARRGQASSGLNLAAQIGSASQAADRQAMTNLGAASESYRNRLNALSQGANLGSQIGREDVDVQQRNVNAINNFNQRMSKQMQDYESQRANAMNKANIYNIEAAQDIENKNVDSRNNAKSLHQNRMDIIANNQARHAQAERNRLDENAKFAHNVRANERAYHNNLQQQKYGNAQGQREYANNLRSKIHADDLSRASGRAGISHQIGANNIGAAQDRNNAIGGITGAVAQYYSGQQGLQDRNAERAHQRDLAHIYAGGRKKNPYTNYDDENEVF